MGMRIHDTSAEAIATAYMDPEALVRYDDELVVNGPALVLEDAGNLEAFVLYGDRDDIRDLIKRIHNAIRRDTLTESERNYLEEFADAHGQDPDDDDWWIDDDDIAWWESADSHSYDLTNGFSRSRSIEED